MDGKFRTASKRRPKRKKKSKNNNMRYQLPLGAIVDNLSRKQEAADMNRATAESALFESDKKPSDREKVLFWQKTQQEGEISRKIV